MDALTFELNPRARHKVPDCLGDEHLTGVGKAADSGRDMNCNSFEFVATANTLASMYTHSHLEPQSLDRLANSLPASDCPSRTIECGMESVASRLDFRASMYGEFPTNCCVVSL